jgi:hypothetical protein
MNRRYAFWIVLLCLALLVTITAAQDAVPTPHPDANVSWPPPVYVLRGEVEIRGTANLPGMSSYFIEFRPLNADLTPQEDTTPWFPATLPSVQPIRDDILGKWNTLTAPDGVYELRLTINLTGQTPQFVLISPIRIENQPPPWVEVNIAQPTQPVIVIPTATAGVQPVSRPTLQPTPTAPDKTPRVTARVDANVRVGDDTIYDRIGILLTGEEVTVIGLSSFNTGWYYVQLKNGSRGFIAPSVVEFSGNLSGLPLINPPPPPTPIATATPIPTNTPQTSANVIISDVDLDPEDPICDLTYEVTIKVKNIGTGPTNSSGALLVVDRDKDTNDQTGITSGAFPILQAGESYKAKVYLTVDTYINETHHISITADSNNEIAELNEGDNGWTESYKLQPGTCS